MNFEGITIYQIIKEFQYIIRLIAPYHVTVPGEYALIWSWKKDIGEERGTWR